MSPTGRPRGGELIRCGQTSRRCPVRRITGADSIHVRRWKIQDISAMRRGHFAELFDFIMSKRLTLPPIIIVLLLVES